MPKAPSELAGICLGQAATHPVELHVEAAGVADRLTLRVPAPQGGGGGVAVGTGQAQPPGRGLRASTGVSRQAGAKLLCLCGL